MMNKYANLSLAVGKVFEAEADTFLSQLEPDTGIELSAKTERKLRKLVKRRDKSYYPLICTAGRRIACIAAIIVVFAVSAMSIKPVRAGVFGFLWSIILITHILLQLMMFFLLMILRWLSIVLKSRKVLRSIF